MCSKESAKPRRREKGGLWNTHSLSEFAFGRWYYPSLNSSWSNKKITSKNKFHIYLIKIFSVSRNPITGEWQAALCSDFLSCKWCIYASALTCQSFTIFFREHPFCLLHGYCFYPENRKKESPVHVGHPFSRPSVLQFQNQYFNNKPEQTLPQRVECEWQCFPCFPWHPGPADVANKTITMLRHFQGMEASGKPQPSFLRHSNCAGGEHKKDTLLISVNTE